MRKIVKSPQIPASLVNAPTPTSATEVLATIYKADDVRSQLLEDQHDKCAYCECSITKAYHDVEHYRPQSHYYWLGHEWKNLLYACNLCNRSLKNDSFPLLDESVKAFKPADDVSLERPLIINPAYVDPSLHIKFRRYEAVGVTREGVETIDMFDLNNLKGKRAELVAARKQVFELYEIEKNLIAKLSPLLSRNDMPNDVRNTIQEAIRNAKLSIKKITSPSHPYSGMLTSQM